MANTVTVNTTDTNQFDILMVQLLQSGIIAQNNFITVQKIMDYDHLEYSRTVSLKQALGIAALKEPTGE